LALAIAAMSAFSFMASVNAAPQRRTVNAGLDTRHRVRLAQISSDPFTSPSSQHATEVEPDTFAFGNTVVAAFQVGRFFTGGSIGIGFAASHNGGHTWPVRTLADEWAYVRVYRSNEARTRALDRWLHTYNHHRGHTSRGGHPPITRATNLAREHN
jgi:transposase InsO family protein